MRNGISGVALCGLLLLTAFELIVGSASLHAREVAGREPARSAETFAPLPSGDMERSLKQLKVPRGIRLLLFSPHPDDETLAAGGLIQRVLNTGGQVRVVFVTNGDAYVEGVRREFQKTTLSATDFVQYGNERHSEAVDALTRLGVQPQNGIFLGFPDQGIDDLWEDYWSGTRPYTSPYTRFKQPLYKSSYERWVEYAGSDLEGEMQRALANYTPDWIVFPDPRDYHPDHSATGLFVLGAFQHTMEKGAVSGGGMRLFSYLVHYPGYPASGTWAYTIAKAGVNDAPALSPVLSAMEWDHFALNRAELERKLLALRAYRTQLLVMGGFFGQFERPSEIFFELEPKTITRLHLRHPAGRS